MWHVYERTLKNQRFLSLQNQINYRQNQLRSPRREQLAAGGVRGREERRVSLGRQLFSQQVEVEMGEDMTRPPPGGFLLLFHATTREMHPSQWDLFPLWHFAVLHVAIKMKSHTRGGTAEEGREGKRCLAWHWPQITQTSKSKMSALLPLCYVTVVVFVIDMICKKQELMLQREREKGAKRAGEREKGRYGRRGNHSVIETGDLALRSVLIFTIHTSKLFANFTLKSHRKLWTSECKLYIPYSSLYATLYHII